MKLIYFFIILLLLSSCQPNIRTYDKNPKIENFENISQIENTSTNNKTQETNIIAAKIINKEIIPNNLTLDVRKNNTLIILNGDLEPRSIKIEIFNAYIFEIISPNESLNITRYPVRKGQAVIEIDGDFSGIAFIE